MQKSSVIHEKSLNENMEKNSAVWNADSVCTLLRLYESNLVMLRTPKKKIEIWKAISNNLKEYDIPMSPDQVRWKINALTKKYKQCINNGHNRFQYFTDLHNIYAQYNLNCYATSELIHKKKYIQEDSRLLADYGIEPESKSVIELRKNRLANKIESDRCQSKVQLENQWLDYLKTQEKQRLLKDDINEKNLQLRQDKLELRRRVLVTRETIELRKLQLIEQEQNALIQLEQDKCEILRQMLI